MLALRSKLQTATAAGSASRQSRRWVNVVKSSQFLVDTIRKQVPKEPHNPFKNENFGDARKKGTTMEPRPVLSFQGEPGTESFYPPSLEDDYKRAWSAFLKAYCGILDTPTRKYHDEVWNCGPINIVKALRPVDIFHPYTKKTTTELQHEVPLFSNEFMFSKGGYSVSKFIGLLSLYTRMLSQLPKSARKPYLDHFYYIVKAIRQNPAEHSVLIREPVYMELVMEYFIVANQPFLSVFVAKELSQTVPIEAFHRNHMQRLLDTEILQSYPQKWVMRLFVNYDRATGLCSKPLSEETIEKLKSNYMQEYHLNRLMSYIFDYYSLPGLVMTDIEISSMIQGLEVANKTKELMDMIPIIILRLHRGPNHKLATHERVDLFYNDKALKWKMSDMSLIAMYTRAFMRIDRSDLALRFLEAVKSMPPKPLEEYSGNTAEFAGALHAVLLTAPVNSSLPISSLTQFVGKGKNRNDNMPLEPVPYKAVLAQEIVSHAAKDNQKFAGALTSLLSSISGRLSTFTAVAIAEKLGKDSPVAALEWIGRNLLLMRPDAQKRICTWMACLMAKNRTAFIGNFCTASTNSPSEMARLASIMGRSMWGNEVDRRHLIADIFMRMLDERNNLAVGILLCTVANGTDAPIKSKHGYQSAKYRAQTLSEYFKKLDFSNMDADILLQYMIPAVSTLGAQTAEKRLWREVLRRGLDPGLYAIKSSLAYKLRNRLDMRNTIGLVEQAINRTPLSNSSNRADMSADALLDVEDQVLADNANPDSYDPNEALAETQTKSQTVWRFYVSILNGLNHAGLFDAVSYMAFYMLKTHSCTLRTFRAVASILLDSTGFNPDTSSDDILRTWTLLNDVGQGICDRHNAESGQTQAVFNLNNYHAAIEACVRKDNLDMAWDFILAEMPKANLKPNKMTLYTLISHLSTNEKMWPISKRTVSKFNEYYPQIITEALQDSDMSLTTRALLSTVLNSSKMSSLTSFSGTRKSASRR
ncbi:hypothetical protein GGI07_001642 [Coemansia sp. Benny D115]|nr:hypothetical protein GGI07_001642 [Coemansia sp. Benny D115]